MLGRPRSVSDEAVFAAVGRVVSAAGPDGLTLAAVGREVGLSAPALGQRFGSKRALLLAFAAHGSAVVDEAFAAGAGSPLRRLRAGFRTLAGSITTPDEAANHLALFHVDLTDDEFRTHALAQHRRVEAEVERLLRAAVAAGELREAPPTRVVLGAYQGAMVTWALVGRGPLHRWVTRAIDDVLRPHRP